MLGSIFPIAHQLESLCFANCRGLLPQTKENLMFLNQTPFGIIIRWQQVPGTQQIGKIFFHRGWHPFHSTCKRQIFCSVWIIYFLSRDCCQHQRQMILPGMRMFAESVLLALTSMGTPVEVKMNIVHDVGNKTTCSSTIDRSQTSKQQPLGLFDKNSTLIRRINHLWTGQMISHEEATQFCVNIGGLVLYLHGAILPTLDW